MATPATTTQSAHPLAHLSGTILLAGAGKMGGALLEGWLALGLAPRNIVVIEPAPAGHLTALADRGVRLNPPRDRIGEVAAVNLQPDDGEKALGEMTEAGVTLV